MKNNNGASKRCYMCDYCAISQPDHPPTSFVYDKRMDGYLCKECLNAVRDTLIDFGPTEAVEADLNGPLSTYLEIESSSVRSNTGLLEASYDPISGVDVDE